MFCIILVILNVSWLDGQSLVFVTYLLSGCLIICIQYKSKRLNRLVIFVCVISLDPQEDLSMLNPTSAGVLENQDMLGGGQFYPPPLNPMFDVQI